jgi:hypothetical protein
MRLLLPSKIPLLRVSYPLVVYFVQSFLPQYQIAERKLEFALLLANLTELGVRQEDRELGIGHVLTPGTRLQMVPFKGNAIYTM